MSRLMTGISSHAFSYEPVFHWNDAWLPMHRSSLPPGARLTEPAPDPAAAALVHRLRGELVDLFRRHRAASNQIARTYPYVDAAEPATRRLLELVKAGLDPGRLMNPGVLGFD